MFSLCDDRYAQPDRFPLVECSVCGSAYICERPAVSELPRLYAKYYGGEWAQTRDVSKFAYREGLRSLLKQSTLYWHYQRLASPTNLYGYVRKPRGLSLLDVGSGQLSWEPRWVTRHGGEWFGVETNTHVADRMRRRGLVVFDTSLERIADSGMRWDVIILSQVLEHVPEPIRFLNAARKLLLTGGEILLSCPNYASRYREEYGKLWIHWHVPYHVCHFTPQSLALAVERAGLAIVWLKTVTPSSWHGAQRMRARADSLDIRRLRSSVIRQAWLNYRHAPSLREDAIVARLMPLQSGVP